MVPDETKVNEDIVNNMETSQKGKSNKRKGKGKHYLPIVRDHLLKRKNWKEIDSQEEYVLPVLRVYLKFCTAMIGKIYP